MAITIYQVSELNKSAQKLLETHFDRIWVEGEISNLARPSSGHIYFSLKDKEAQIRCAMFRPRLSNINFDIKNGALVQVFAKVSLYPDRGDYQLIVDKMQLSGHGALQEAYQQLLKKLQQEGLFATEYKKPLPYLPRSIGLITSRTGAALRDILQVLQRRCPQIPIIIYPTMVQGADAAPQIVAAINSANWHNKADVLIVARGGGSIEDLWPFNEEVVARAIFASKLPIITGIGHEIDYTIADYVADYRAPTPSAAAEMVSPDRSQLLAYVQELQRRLNAAIQNKLGYLAQTLDWLLKRLRDPTSRLNEWQLALRMTVEQLKTAIKQQLSHNSYRYQLIAQQLINWPARIANLKPNLQQSKQLLAQAMLNKLRLKRHNLALLVTQLEALSPLKILSRGFAIVYHQGQLVKKVAELAPKDIIEVKLADGTMQCQVLKT